MSWHGQNHLALFRFGRVSLCDDLPDDYAMKISVLTRPIADLVDFC